MFNVGLIAAGGDGLGPELIANRDFASNSDGWTANATNWSRVVNLGAPHVRKNNTNGSPITYQITLPAGQRFRFAFDVHPSSSPGQITVSNTSFSAVVTAGNSYSGVVTSAFGTDIPLAVLASAANMRLTNFSLRRIL